MTKFQLLNGNPIDEDMVEWAMEDADTTHSYYLNTQTGEVIAFSEDDDDPSDEREKLLDEIDGTDNYIEIERIPSYEHISGWKILSLNLSLRKTHRLPKNYPSH